MLLLLLLFQQTALLHLILFLLLSLLFSPPPLLLDLFILLLDGLEPDGPWCPSLDLRGPDPLAHNTNACRARAVLGLIPNSDGVAHSPRLGRLGGSLLTMGTRHLALSRGRKDDSIAITPLRRSRWGLVVTSGRSRVGRTCIRPETARQSQGTSVLSKANPMITKRETNHLPRTLEPAPTLSLLAIKGWACSMASSTRAKKKGLKVAEAGGQTRQQR